MKKGRGISQSKPPHHSSCSLTSHPKPRNRNTSCAHREREGAKSAATGEGTWVTGWRAVPDQRGQYHQRKREKMQDKLQQG